MEAVSRPRVKICCISSKEEAQLAIRYGADALGLVSQMPSGPGVIPEELIAEIAETIPPPIASFLLTSQQDVEAIIDQQRRCRTNTLQLVDRLPPGSHQRLRAALPGIALVQVIHVRGPESVEEAQEIAPFVDALLLDSGRPDLPVKILGGTGQVHDWKISRRIRETVPIPVFLAGGISAENARAAIEEVAPFGLDLCSSVRTEGRLDPRKLERFFAQVGRLPL
ncbi:N-(5'-phosphoribosyl)anthranilate isomerase [Thermogemmatispora aurantia]|uniref:N-(5'-phosphoribosyl)anthranilate isomerase n=1 Tax=Thermogemmatispora aurantia TaxID=2045279 RepID=A0A5J4K512_9CHLR|nr:phosphoribosylanthranilate isomerase [Thermogemmatispora aurantia]GER81810.1 N-(5'-phosphoribosyl)anthranilate isomerase [Thermogemmatispora aurantia]